jgi:hypothetical protein
MENLISPPKKIENPTTAPINADVMNLLKNKGKKEKIPEVEQVKENLKKIIIQYKLDPQRLIKAGKMSEAGLRDPKMYQIAIQMAIKEGFITPQEVQPGIDYKLLANGITVGRLTQELLSEGKI